MHKMAQDNPGEPNLTQLSGVNAPLEVIEVNGVIDDSFCGCFGCFLLFFSGHIYCR